MQKKSCRYSISSAVCAQGPPLPPKSQMHPAVPTDATGRQRDGPRNGNIDTNRRNRFSAMSPNNKWRWRVQVLPWSERISIMHLAVLSQHRRVTTPQHQSRGVNLVGNLGGDDDRLLSGPNFLLAKLAVLKHQTQ